MKKSISQVLVVLAFALVSGNLLAQQDGDYHPGLSDDFTVLLGAFNSKNTFRLAADGTIEDGDNTIDFGNAVGVDENSTIFNGQLRWKFGKQRKWSLWGQYFKNDSNGEAVLLEDITWQDITFKEGTFVGAGVELEVVRLFVGRSLLKNQQHDVGIGLGVHNLSLGAFIEGEVETAELTTGFRRGDASISQILPNVGGWWLYSPTRKWLLRSRVDWISANIGNYDGTLWNASFGINYQAFQHVGFELGYQYFDLDIDIDKTNWSGNVNMRYSGPMLTLSANW